MSIWKKITGQFIDIIEWVDDTRDTLVWKYPDEDKEVKMGAQLTVRESQVALFVNEGKLADVYQPGRHELVTRNMPILSTLRGWKYGFESPFKVDVYFVSTRLFNDMRWGTKQPIMVSDPEFSLVQMRAFGTFSFQVSDAALFFRNFAGTDPHVRTEEVVEQFRSRVVTVFSNALKKSGKTLAEINFKANELGDDLLPMLQPEFAEVGLKLARFNVESVSLPDEIQKALTEQDLEMRGKRKGMSIDNEMEIQRLMNKATLSQNIPDMEKFMQMQAALGMEGTGGAPGEGSDLMKTMYQMNMMQQMLNKQGTPAGQSPTAAPAGDAAKPMSREEIMQTLKDLGDLKAAGIVSEAEFEAKKQELLGRL